MTRHYHLWIVIVTLFCAFCLFGIRVFAQDKPPERNELFWCQQQRNFFADNAASTAAMASRLEKERDALKAELEELKKKVPSDKN